MANELEIIVAVPSGKLYHLKSASKVCPNRIIGMLTSDYLEINFDEVNIRRLTPCDCNFIDRGPRT